MDQSRKHQASFISSKHNVLLHENNKILYTAPFTGDAWIKSRYLDYMLMYMAVSVLTGINFTYAIPLAVISVTIPRRFSILAYYTFHAELMPHTEQVAFMKANLFGHKRHIIVNIKDLERIDVEEVPNKLLFAMN